jgi:hypothetical protein
MVGFDDIIRGIYVAMKTQEAYKLLNQFKEEIDEDMRRKKLRVGSIDVEFRVIK